MNESEVPRETFGTESEVAAACDERLMAARWKIKKLSQPSRTWKQLEDLPDRMCFRRNVLMMIEYKSSTGQLTDGQRAFFYWLHPELGPNVHYLVIAHPAALPAWAVE